MGLPSLGVAAADLTFLNIYRKTATIQDINNPVESFKKMFSQEACYLEPLAPISPFSTTLQSTHRAFFSYREDIKAEDRFIELDAEGAETNVKYTVKFIQRYRPHHIEVYLGVDSQPGVV